MLANPANTPWNMATISIYLDTRNAGANESPVKAVITQNRKSAMLPLGVKVQPDYWNDKTKSVSESHPNHRYLNTFIHGRKFAIEAELIKLETIRKISDMSVTQIRDAIDEAMNPEKKLAKEKEKTFLFRYERFMSLKTRKNTINGYRWTLNKLKEFDPHLKAKRFEDITIDYINDFNAFFARRECVNSRNVSMRYIRAVFRDAIKAGITTNYPFSQIRIKKQMTRKKALSLEKMRELINYPCDGMQREYRDMFVLMFLFRGINIGDLLLADKSSIVDGRFEYRRSKVGTLFSIKLEPEALEIIQRYPGKKYLLSPMDRYKDYMDYLHHLNDGLKAIGKTRGKGDSLFPGISSNWARHTWSTIGLNIDVPVEVLSRGMGHSGALAVTQIYMDFDMKKVDQASRRIIDYVFYNIDYRNVNY